jgi:hypothetical protein
MAPTPRHRDNTGREYVKTSTYGDVISALTDDDAQLGRHSGLLNGQENQDGRLCSADMSTGGRLVSVSNGADLMLKA